jgi:hypothetical protein
MRATLLLVSILLSIRSPGNDRRRGVLLTFEAFHGEHHKHAAICYASPPSLALDAPSGSKRRAFVAPLVLHADELVKDPARVATALVFTTLRYVQPAPSDVGRENARAVANRSRLPSPPKCMSQPRRTLEEIFQAHVQTLALTLQPFTIVKYDYVARHFVSYLRSTFPDVRRLSQLRRDPHMLGWFRWLFELGPPIGNHSRAASPRLRRLLDGQAAQGHPIQLASSSARTSRFVPKYLPRPLSPGRRSTPASGTESRRQSVLQCAAPDASHRYSCR